MTSTPLPTGLMLVHGNQSEALRDLLVAWMKRYPLAPLENEIILVHSNGIAQWLTLALAADRTEGDGGGCGIAAGLDMSLPSRFLWQVYRAVLGPSSVPETSPFDKPLLVWRLMRLLPHVMTQPEYAPLQRFLADDADLRKRFQLAERLADLFDQYQVYRADWLAAWAAGEDVLIRARGERPPLATDQRWQASLWRALLADVGDGGDTSRAAVHEAFLKKSELWPADQRPAGLPRRVMVFGISALPRQSLEVLATLSRWSQVLMCVHNPCEHYWADVVADKDLLRAAHKRQQRRVGMPAELSDDVLHLHAHPLLAAWGKQGRDFIGLLDEHDSDASRAGYLQHFVDIRQRIDLFSSHGEVRLLNQLQDDIRDLRPLAETRGRWPAVDAAKDESIRFHIAHSPQREVEILHDQLLAAFNADPSLRPRDIIVMMPDVDAYAPHIQAVFGLTEAQDRRHIPFAIADQARRQNDPLLQACETLLALPRGRIAVSDVLDLLEVPALRQRFDISEDDLPLLHRWILGANIRWGLHAGHRESLGLPKDHGENTWLFGIRRMLLGYAVGSAAQPWQDIEPYDEIGGLNAALLGPLVQFLDRLESTWLTLGTPATVAEWCLRLRALMTDFFLTEDSNDAFTLLQLENALQDWQAACGDAQLTEPLPLAVVGAYWLAQIDGGSLSQRFFAGTVTFATLMPMRAIPFRQVCLLGMNDGDYPRTKVPMDFDLMGKDYRPGDRSRREDDRYLFLEALLSARECLRISWVGRSVNDNTPRPPSVLVGQLRDHLGAGWRLTGCALENAKAAEKLLAALTVAHPLQAFSRAYFPAEGANTPWFTYAREWRTASAMPADGNGALPELTREEPLSVTELASFLRDPVKAFFQQRLRVYFETDDPTSADQEPFALDGLQKWGLQNELITVQADALLRGESRQVALDTQLARMHRRGELAAKGFALAMESALKAPMEDLFERYGKALEDWPELVEREAEIRFHCETTGLELADWLRGVRLNAAGERGRVVLESSDVVKKGVYQGHTLIKHWVLHLAAHFAGGPLTTEVISKVGSVTLRALEVDEARRLLTQILTAWQAGLCRPLPLAAKTAFAWLGKGGQVGKDNDAALRVARSAFDGAFKQTGELEQSGYLQRAYPDFDALTESGEFADLADTLLRPLFEAMPVESKTKDTGVSA